MKWEIALSLSCRFVSYCTEMRSRITGDLPNPARGDSTYTISAFECLRMLAEVRHGTAEFCDF
jgi:hypothetical protein